MDINHCEVQSRIKSSIHCKFTSSEESEEAKAAGSPKHNIIRNDWCSTDIRSAVTGWLALRQIRTLVSFDPPQEMLKPKTIMVSGSGKPESICKEWTVNK